MGAQPKSKSRSEQDFWERRRQIDKLNRSTSPVFLGATFAARVLVLFWLMLMFFGLFLVLVDHSCSVASLLACLLFRIIGFLFWTWTSAIIKAHF